MSLQTVPSSSAWLQPLHPSLTTWLPHVCFRPQHDSYVSHIPLNTHPSLHLFPHFLCSVLLHRPPPQVDHPPPGQVWRRPSFHFLFLLGPGMGGFSIELMNPSHKGSFEAEGNYDPEAWNIGISSLPFRMEVDCYLSSLLKLKGERGAGVRGAAQQLAPHPSTLNGTGSR